MKRFGVLFVVLLLFSFVVKAQWGDDEMEEKPSFRDRIFTGGGFGLSFTSYTDYFSISPLIGYKITSKLAAGIQFQYRYTNYKTVTPRISTNDYGASPFVRYFVYPPFFIHTEYEYLNYQFIGSKTEKFRRSYNSFMAGGGFFQSIGGRAGIYAMALYNFSYVNSYNYSPYSSPWVFRVGITAGF
jgi:hypothetical protein